MAPVTVTAVTAVREVTSGWEVHMDDPVAEKNALALRLRQR